MSGISWMTDLKNVSACGTQLCSSAASPASLNSAIRRKISSIDGIVMWQYAKQPFTKAEVFLLWRPRTSASVFIVSFSALQRNNIVIDHGGRLHRYAVIL